MLINSETSKCPKKNRAKKVYSLKFLARIQKIIIQTFWECVVNEKRNFYKKN
jgi:hypothetical protein